MRSVPLRAFLAGAACAAAAAICIPAHAAEEPFPTCETSAAAICGVAHQYPEFAASCEAVTSYCKSPQRFKPLDEKRMASGCWLHGHEAGDRMDAATVTRTLARRALQGDGAYTLVVQGGGEEMWLSGNGLKATQVEDAVEQVLTLIERCRRGEVEKPATNPADGSEKANPVG